MDIFQVCVEEVSLEGLDGITFPSLWKRFSSREPTITVVLSDSLKQHFWKYLVDNKDFRFYVLNEKRSDVIIFDRFTGHDPLTGNRIAVAPDELDIAVEVYTVKPIDDIVLKVKGSCNEYKTRMDVTDILKKEKVDLKTAMDRFGAQSLVVVASQSVREYYLLPPGHNPQLIENLSEIEYCILERIGRSRWQGEIQTFLNTVVFKNQKTSHIHYIMKSLYSKGIVCKQNYSYERGDKANKLYQQVLLNLSHYKPDVRSGSDRKTDEICTLLEAAPNQTLSVFTIKASIEISDSTFKKLKRKLLTLGVLKVLPKGKEKRKRGDVDLQLIKWPTNVKQEEETEEDNDLSVVASSGNGPGLVAELPIVLQGFRYLISTGEEGCSQVQMLNVLKGYGSLEGRHICRKIEKAGIVNTIMVEQGKQRVQKYIAKHFASNSSLTKQFQAEKIKMQAMFETSVMSAISAGEEESQNASELQAIVLSQSQGEAPSQHDDATGIVSLSESSMALMCVNSSINDSTASNLDDSISSLVTGKQGGFMDSPLSCGVRGNHLTARKMRRTNLILGYVNEQKVTEGLFPIQKYLITEETRLGSTNKICKKTVLRAVQKMNDDGMLKYMIIPITCNGRTHEVDFVMSLDCTANRLKTAMDQAQFKMLSHENNRLSKDIALKNAKEKTPLSLLGMDPSSDDPPLDIKPEPLPPSASNPLNAFQPKHMRAKIVHSFLWYLAYGRPGSDIANNIDYDEVKEYCQENTWRKYLPPLSTHPTYGPGWLQVGEAGFLLPLSVICQFQRYAYKIDDIEDYINDPVKCHCLVRHLPTKMKTLLLHKRKYLFSFTQIIEMLCFMGLATLSQQKSMNNVCLKKEQEMVYIHRNVSVVDTRKSEKQYMYISEDVDYERLSFSLNSIYDVEQYWGRVKDICLMTPLGVNNNHTFDEAHKHCTLTKKFIQAQVHREVSTPKDDGSIPGDGRGAGGFDSSLFSHLYRNWFRSIRSKKHHPNFGNEAYAPPPSRIKRLPKLVQSEIGNLGEAPKRKRRSAANKNAQNGVDSPANKKKRGSAKKSKTPVVSLPKTSTPNVNKKRKSSLAEAEFERVIVDNVGRNERVKGGRGSKRKATPEKAPEKTPEKDPDTPNPPPGKRKKKLGKEEVRQRKKYVDPRDIKALKLLVQMTGKQRSFFTPEEDGLLLICRIASTIIMKKVCPKKPVSLLCVRDVLNAHCSASMTKTSYACGRRIRLIMKNDHNRISHQLSVADVLADKKFMFSIFGDEPKKKAENLAETFAIFVSKLQERLKSRTGIFEQVIPDSVAELHQSYEALPNVHDSEPKFGKVRDLSLIRVPSDINSCVLEIMMYATLYMTTHVRRLQAHKLFETYPQKLLHEVWERIQKSGNVKLKVDACLAPRKSRLPFGVPAYQLSKAHFRLFDSAMLPTVCDDTLESAKQLDSSRSAEYGINSSPGSVVLMAMTYLSGNTDVTKQLPDRITAHPRRFNEPSKERKSQDSDEDTLDELFNHCNEPRKPGTAPYNREALKLNPCLITLRLSQPQGSVTTPQVKRGAEDGVKMLQSRFLKDDGHVIAEDINGAVRRDVDALVRDRPEFDHVASDLLDHVISLGVLGCPEPDVENHFRNSHKVSLVRSCIAEFVRRCIFYKVGHSCFRLVVRSYAAKWFTKGFRFKGADLELSERLLEQAAYDMSRFDPVTFLCRPWHDVTGTVDVATCVMFVTGVFQQVLWHPGITQEAIFEYFGECTPGIAILDVLEVLTESKCVERHLIPVEPTWSLFGGADENPPKSGGDRVYFTPRMDAILRMAKLRELLTKRNCDVTT